MKKQILVLLLLTAVVLFTAGCGGDAAALDAVEVELYAERYDVEGVIVEVTYPVVSSSEKQAEELIAALNQEFQGEVETFFSLVASNYAGTAQTDADFSCVMNVLYNEKGMLSIVTDQHCGEDYFRYAATYRLSDGEKMTLGELMDMDEEKAKETLIQRFGGVFQAYPDGFYADAAEYVAEHIDEVQFYRYSEGISVFFPSGSISPEEMGVQEMVV